MLLVFSFLQCSWKRTSFSRVKGKLPRHVGKQSLDTKHNILTVPESQRTWRKIELRKDCSLRITKNQRIFDTGAWVLGFETQISIVLIINRSSSCSQKEQLIGNERKITEQIHYFLEFGITKLRITDWNRNNLLSILGVYSSYSSFAGFTEYGGTLCYVKRLLWGHERPLPAW